MRGGGGGKKQQIDIHTQYDLPICVHICYTIKVLGVYNVQRYYVHTCVPLTVSMTSDMLTYICL